MNPSAHLKAECWAFLTGQHMWSPFSLGSLVTSPRGQRKQSQQTGFWKAREYNRDDSTPGSASGRQIYSIRGESRVI